jgi:nicotinate-nucleotide adenylyltransferase
MLRMTRIKTFEKFDIFVLIRDKSFSQLYSHLQCLSYFSRYTLPMKKKRIGIFGGTFDPPHLGHLILACEIHSQLRLDRLLWVLTPDPPHKRDRAITPLVHRQRMVALAIGDNTHFELSLVEAEREGPHYSVDTVAIIKERNPNAEVIFLMGGDSLQDLPNWHRPGDFVQVCDEIGVMRRPGDVVDVDSVHDAVANLKSKLRFVDAPLLEIASRQIRLRAQEGRPYRYYLPTAIYEYIQREKLYIANYTNVANNTNGE